MMSLLPHFDKTTGDLGRSFPNIPPSEVRRRLRIRSEARSTSRSHLDPARSRRRSRLQRGRARRKVQTRRIRFCFPAVIADSERSCSQRIENSKSTGSGLENTIELCRALLRHLSDAKTKVERLVEEHSEPGSAAERSPPRPETVRSMIKLRARRRRVFAENLFGEPGWDLLLGLYLAELEDRVESISSLACASDVPMTTALRWTSMLIKGGWIEREQDSTDARRILLRLSEKARSGMDSFFNQPEMFRLIA